MSKLLGKLRGGKRSSQNRDDLDWMDFDEDDYDEDDCDADEDEFYEADEDEDDEEYYEADDEEGYADDDEYYEADDEECYEAADDEWEYEDEGEYYEDEEECEDDDEYYEVEEEEEYEEDEEGYEEDDEYYEEEEDDGEEYEGDEEYYEVEEDEEEYEEDDEYYEEEEDDGEEYEGDEEYYEVEENEEEYEEDDEYYEEEEDDGEEYEGDEEYYEVEENEEEYEEDDEYYEEEEDDEEEYEDEEDEDDDGEAAGIRKVVSKIANMSAIDHIVALTGAAVLILAVVTGTLYLNARNNQSQLETFAEIGAGMEDIDMIGENGLVAIADAQSAKLMAAEIEEEQEENAEQESVSKVEVTMDLTSIQKDLKIKFINKETGKLIPNVEFEVEAEKPSGGTVTFKDEDKDGIIYKTGMEPGKYKVKIISPASAEEYNISSEATAITVRDTIEYKKVDVSNEVKTEAQVNAAVEDTKVKETVVESANTDTVEWVESTKTLIEGTEETEESYEKIDRSKIADPAQQAYAGFRLLAAVDGQTAATPETGGGENGGSAAATPTAKPDDQETVATPEPTAEPTPEPTAPPTAEPTAPPTAPPTEAPTAPPTAVPTEKPTAAPTAKPTAAPTAKPTAAPTAKPTAAPTATPTAAPTATPSAVPTATPVPTATASPTATPKDVKTDTVSTLKTTDGEILYVKDENGNFREAKYADFYNSEIREFYRKTNKTKGEYRYTGWQEIDGATYFFDKDGNKVIGEQVIQGAKYNFNSDGSLNTGSGHLGIDVSKWNGNVDWAAVKNSGVSYVIIRCGYRGSTTGALIEDPMFRSHIKGAANAGLKVGVYFFTQAVNEVEAVEEASMVLGLIKGYNISYPVFLDVEPSNGRGDKIDASTRTAVCKAFCQTIQNSGYKSGIYANKTWLESYLDASSLTSYKIWLAQYAAAPSYNKTKYDMWQYSSKGNVSGISGGVDMNISYMGY